MLRTDVLRLTPSLEGISAREWVVESLVDVLVTTYEVSWSCMLLALEFFLKGIKRPALVVQDRHLVLLTGLVEKLGGRRFAT